MFSTLVVLAALVWSSTVLAQAPFFQGKTITIAAGTKAGDVYDLYPRLLAEYMPKHIPGSPNIIVPNIPGAASLIGTRDFRAGLDFDLVLAGDFRFPGGTSSAIAEAIRAQAPLGYRCGLLHVASPLLPADFPIHPDIQACLDSYLADPIQRQGTASQPPSSKSTIHWPSATPHPPRHCVKRGLLRTAPSWWRIIRPSTGPAGSNMTPVQLTPSSHHWPPTACCGRRFRHRSGASSLPLRHA